MFYIGCVAGVLLSALLFTLVLVKHKYNLIGMVLDNMDGDKAADLIKIGKGTRSCFLAFTEVGFTEKEAATMTILAMCVINA